MGNWAYFDLKRKIDYKAAQNGIRVVCVATRTHEHRCSQCGHLNPKTAMPGGTFKCQACGLTTSIDDNAIQNLTVFPSNNKVT